MRYFRQSDLSLAPSIESLSDFDCPFRSLVPSVSVPGETVPPPSPAPISGSVTLSPGPDPIPVHGSDLVPVLTLPDLVTPGDPPEIFDVPELANSPPLTAPMKKILRDPLSHGRPRLSRFVALALLRRMPVAALSSAPTPFS